MIVKTGLQDATKNVRIYGTISAASSPSARPFHRRRASRIALRYPFSSPLARLFLTPARIFFSPRSPTAAAVVSRNARRFLLPLLGSSLRASVPSFHPSMFSFVIPTRSLDSGRKGGPTTRRASTAGRDRPHRRGHHFNVTLIKSNNQYLPRKKF